jgi:hypothetical protein
MASSSAYPLADKRDDRTDGEAMTRDGQQAHAIIRGWIVDIIEQRGEIVGMAMSQRAKFEGWLKFELADAARRNGATNVKFEPPLTPGRADLSFDFDGVPCVIELKTPNTNYRMAGVESHSRPITQNIASIVVDAEKLAACGGGVIAFILFPLKTGDDAWLDYLKGLSGKVGQTLSKDEHASRRTVALPNGGGADVAVVTIEVPGR